MSLRQHATWGAGWTGASSAIVTVLQLGQLAILARLLRPEDFGLLAMIMIVIGLAQAYADMGISNAIIYRQDTTRDQLSSLYWLNILAGVIVFLAVIASVPLIVTLYREPRLAELIPWAASIFLVVPLGRQFQVLLQKNLRFRALAIVDVSAAAAGAVVAIASALAGHGVLALIWGHLARTVLSSVVLAGYGWREWRPGLRFRRADLRGYLGFGLFQMGENTVNYVNQRLDQLVIGTILGAEALGYYHLAFNLVVQPVARINPVFTRVAFPVFARVQDDAVKLKRGFMAMRQTLAAINAPLLFGMAAIAPAFVPLVLGEQWMPSIVLIQVLAFVALLRSLGNPDGSLLLAKGRADLGFYWNCGLLVTQVPTIYLSAQLWGALGVSLALLAMQFVYFWAAYAVIVRRLLGPCLSLHIRTLVPAVTTACLMALAVAALAHVAKHPTHLLLFVQVSAGAVLYLGLNWLLYRDQTVSMLNLVRGEGR